MQMLVIVIVFSAVVPSYISLAVTNNDVLITRNLVIKKKHLRRRILFSSGNNFWTFTETTQFHEERHFQERERERESERKKIKKIVERVTMVLLLFSTTKF